MNRLESIAILLAAWLAVAFEITFNGFRSTLGAQFSLLPALMVYVALSSSLPTMAMLAVVGGLMQDAFSANPLGVTTLALSLTGFMLHRQRDLVLRDQLYAQVMTGFLASSLVPACVMVVLMNTHHPVPLSWRLLGQWLVMAAGGALVTPLVFRLFAQVKQLFAYQPVPESHYSETRQIKRTRF
ncbi:MAG: rod shape-determining protein MreD [Verrucomicrobia bacterium]|nr:rod shape-determining protein MreD [Verrucomicrobiota bacterium]